MAFMTSCTQIVDRGNLAGVQKCALRSILVTTHPINRVISIHTEHSSLVIDMYTVNTFISILIGLKCPVPFGMHSGYLRALSHSMKIYQGLGQYIKHPFQGRRRYITAVQDRFLRRSAPLPEKEFCIDIRK